LEGSVEARGATVQSLKAEVMINKVRVSSEDEAKQLRFPGSPTVRINGFDIDPAAKQVAGYIGCRIYVYKGRTYEYPPKEMIESALERLLKK